MRDFVSDITRFSSGLVISSRLDQNATIEGKRFGITLDNQFSGLELSVYGGVLPNGITRLIMKIYRDGTPIITYDNANNVNEFGNSLPKFTFNDAISILDPLDLRFPELDNNTVIVKGKLNKFASSALWQDGKKTYN